MDCIEIKGYAWQMACLYDRARVDRAQVYHEHLEELKTPCDPYRHIDRERDIVKALGLERIGPWLKLNAGLFVNATTEQSGTSEETLYNIGESLKDYAAKAYAANLVASCKNFYVHERTYKLSQQLLMEEFNRVVEEELASRGEDVDGMKFHDPYGIAYPIVLSVLSGETSGNEGGVLRRAFGYENDSVVPNDYDEWNDGMEMITGKEDNKYVIVGGGGLVFTLSALSVLTVGGIVYGIGYGMRLAIPYACGGAFFAGVGTAMGSNERADYERIEWLFNSTDPRVVL